MKILESLNLARVMYFPLTRKERERYLGLVRERVSYYSPLIEQKTGADLGDVEVKEYRYVIGDICRENKRKLLTELKELHNGKLGKFDELSIEMMYLTIRPIGELFRMTAEEFISMKVYNSSIYVGFGMLSKIEALNCLQKGESPYLDHVLIHELSHVLWDRLSDNMLHRNNFSAVWNEGFATYCERKHFREFYPSESKIGEYPGKIYEIGEQRIRAVVERHGIEALLEIPNRWEEFERELSCEK